MSYGRTKIYSDAKEITAANVVEEVSNAYSLHCRNQADIKALWDCYRGRTKILHKTKEIREEINHKINVNVAYEVTKFHKGYLFGEPIQCMCAGSALRLRRLTMQLPPTSIRSTDIWRLQTSPLWTTPLRSGCTLRVWATA